MTEERSPFAALVQTGEREVDRKTRDALLVRIHEICKPLRDKEISDEQRRAILEKSKPLVDEVVRADWRLVLAVMKRLPGIGEQEDREAVGLIGLVKAARDFDPELGYTFATFATRYIKNEILRSISKHHVLGYGDYTQTRRDEIVGPTRSSIRDAELELENGVGEGYIDRHLPILLEKRGLSGAVHDARADVMRVEDLLIRARSDGQPEPEVRQLCSDLGLDSQRVLTAKLLLKEIRSCVMYEKFPRLDQVELDRPADFREGGSDKSIAETISLQAWTGPSESDRAVDRELIRVALAKLPVAARLVFQLHAYEGYPLKGGRDAKLGDVLGLSQERAGQLLEYARHRLRAELRHLPEAEGIGIDSSTVEIPKAERNHELEAHAAAKALGGEKLVTEAGFIAGVVHLREFFRHHGHASISAMHSEADGFPLGAWVRLQKRLDWEKLLDPARKRAIKLAAPNFSWKMHVNPFDEGLRHLRSFVRREGHSRVPQSHVETNGYHLGHWIHNLRAAARGAEFDETRRGAVMSAAPDFQWNPAPETSTGAFALGVHKLREFRAANGHPNVPQKYVCPDGFRLGQWVTWIRYKPPTVARREQIVNAVPDFAWSLQRDSNDNSFTTHLLLLRRFADREGHISVPRPYTEEGKRLGAWVKNLRSRKDGLSAERLEQIRSVVPELAKELGMVVA